VVLIGSFELRFISIIYYLVFCYLLFDLLLLLFFVWKSIYGQSATVGAKRIRKS
jgi:hypothetical protein